MISKPVSPAKPDPTTTARYKTTAKDLLNIMTVVM